MAPEEGSSVTKQLLDRPQVAGVQVTQCGGGMSKRMVRETRCPSAHRTDRQHPAQRVRDRFYASDTRYLWLLRAIAVKGGCRSQAQFDIRKDKLLLSLTCRVTVGLLRF